MSLDSGWWVIRMSGKHLRLNCNRCVRFTRYDEEQTASDGTVIVRCGRCGKRNSDANIHMVDPNRRFARDESGELLESLP